MTSEFITTSTTHWGKVDSTVSRDKQIVAFVHKQLQWFSNARLKREEVWTECWAAYLGSPEAMDSMRKTFLRTVGDVENDWRHKINVGKAFENVETIVAYLQAAFFPNKDWFDAIPSEPGYMDLVPVIKQFTREKFRQGKFISHWEMFLRQCCITGVSVIALPWRYEAIPKKKKVKVNQPLYPNNVIDLDSKAKYKEVVYEKVLSNRPEFETLDVFDVYFQPNCIDLNDSPIIRRLTKTKAELAQCVSSGHFKSLTYEDIERAKAYIPGNSESNKELIKYYQGLDLNDAFNWGDEVELYEYWGDVHLDGITYHDVVATVCCGQLVRFETNPYWCGKPFVVGSYIPIVRSISALGTIEPSLGMLHELNIVTNQRLDNLEISINSMWEMVNDGTLQPEDVYSAPGRVFPVAQTGNLKPVEMPNNFTITYDESSVLETRIDKNTGTGSYVSPNSARSGERVTATEIQAVREAGGNRLSGVHKHLEETALFLVLEKCFKLFQQFITDDEIIRIPGKEQDSYDYVSVGAEELQYDFRLEPIGADHVADKEYEINKTLQFLQVSAQYPQMAEHVNFYKILLKLATLFGFDDVDQYIIEKMNEESMTAQQGQQPMQQPINGQDALMKEMYEAGGVPMQNALQSNLQADGGANLMSEMFGINSQEALPAVPPQMPVA
jgi:hypothetical protein